MLASHAAVTDEVMEKIYSADTSSLSGAERTFRERSGQQLSVYAMVSGAPCAVVMTPTSLWLLVRRDVAGPTELHGRDLVLGKIVWDVTGTYARQRAETEQAVKPTKSADIQTAAGPQSKQERPERWPSSLVSHLYAIVLFATGKRKLPIADRASLFRKT